MHTDAFPVPGHVMLRTCLELYQCSGSKLPLDVAPLDQTQAPKQTYGILPALVENNKINRKFVTD